MSYQSFVPAVWNPKILKNLNNQHVYGQCFNRDYEGDIGDKGSSVVINSHGRVTTFAVTRNTDIPVAETLDTEAQNLVITEARGFNFMIDNIDKRQAAGDLMSSAMTEAAFALSQDADDFLGDILRDGVATANTLTAVTVGNGAGEKSAFDQLALMRLLLTENNTPMEGRWVVVPPWIESLLLLDERFIGFGTGESNTRLRGAPIGRAADFTVYQTNNCARDGSEYVLLGGYKGAATFAEQISNTVPYSPERRIKGDAVKGEHVYGAKVTRPNNIVRLDATRGVIAD